MMRPNLSPEAPVQLLALVRVSTQGQADEGTPETQRDIIRQIASRHGIPEARITWIEVSGVSGGNWTQTPEWQGQVRPYLKDPSVHIACYHSDRVCRATNGAELAALDEILATGTRVYHPMGVSVPAEDGDNTFAYMEALFAGREKARIKARTWDAKERMRRQGAAPDPRHLPLGITYSPVSRTWGYSESAEIIRLAFRLYVHEGEDNLTEIGRQCGGVDPSTVHGWLSQPLYKGIRVIDHWARGEYVPGPDGRQGKRKLIPRPADQVIRVRVFSESEQLIDDRTWEEANKRLAKRVGKRRAARTTHADSIWLTGRLWSGHEPLGPTQDGWITLDLGRAPVHIVYGTSGGTVGPRYHCACSGTSSKLDRCALRHLKAETINSALDAYLTSLAQESWFRAQVLAETDDGRRSKVDERPVLTAQIRAVEGKIQKLVDLLLDDRIDRPTYDRRHDGLTAERTKLQGALDALAQAPTVDRQTVEEALAALTWDASWTAQTKRDWLARYQVRIIVSNSGVESVHLRFPGVDLPTYVLGHRMTWESLTGVADPADRVSRAMGEGFYARAEAAVYLGVTVTRWGYWAKRGYLPEPDRKIGTRGEWHRDTLDGLRERFGL